MSSATTGNEKAQRTRGRGLWLTLHLWLALIAGALFALMGLSGALLVLKGPLVRHDFGAAAFDPPTAAPAMPRPVDAWLDAARARYPQLRTVFSVTAPGASPLPTRAGLVTAMLDDGDFGFVTVDAASGQPIGFFRYGEGWLFKALEFHRHLLLPGAAEAWGENIVAATGLLLLASIGSGVYLWWPRREGWRRWRAGSVRRLHATTAIWLALPLALVATSGVLLARPAWLAHAIGAPPARPAANANGTACRALAGYQDAIDTALHATGAAAFRSVAALPDGSAYAVTLQARAGSEFDEVAVQVDARCARVSAAPFDDDRRDPAVQALHARLLLGAPGRALVLVAGLALPGLYGTGLWMWWRRRRARKAAAW